MYEASQERSTMQGGLECSIAVHPYLAMFPNCLRLCVRGVQYQAAVETPWRVKLCGSEAQLTSGRSSCDAEADACEGPSPKTSRLSGEGALDWSRTQRSFAGMYVYMYIYIYVIYYYCIFRTSQKS